MRLDYRNFMDDEEVTLLPHRRDMDDPDPAPGSDIRDGPNTSDTQRDDWLLKMEPLQGARPKWNVGERPPVVDDRTEVLDLEATGAVGVGMWSNMEIWPLCCHSSGRYYRRRR